MKKWMVGVSLLLGALILVLCGMYFHHLRSFPIKEEALIKNMTERVNDSGGTGVEIQVRNVVDIGNFRTFLFTVKKEDFTNLNDMLGFAFYEKSWSGQRYRFDGMGWGTNTLDSYLFEATVESKKQKLLVVYGKNPSETNKFEQFKVNLHDEVFVGDLSGEQYFVEVFPVTTNNKESTTTSIIFQTQDHDFESYPLIVTSKMK